MPLFEPAKSNILKAVTSIEAIEATTPTLAADVEKVIADIALIIGAITVVAPVPA